MVVQHNLQAMNANRMLGMTQSAQAKSSEKLASFISDKAVSGVSEFSFVIGGSDGIAKAVTSRADMRLCLSPMTFTHQMTRLIIAEQLYRAMKINNGEQYHK